MENLILDKQVDTFFVGNHGGFDRMVKETLLQLQKKYPHITCHVVLAYLPRSEKEEADFPKPEAEDIPTVYPSLERVPQRFAISYRNRWMVEQADYVIGYIRYSWGGASQFFRMAQRQKKTTINLYEASSDNKANAMK